MLRKSFSACLLLCVLPTRSLEFDAKIAHFPRKDKERKQHESWTTPQVNDDEVLGEKIRDALESASSLPLPSRLIVLDYLQNEEYAWTRGRHRFWGRSAPKGLASSPCGNYISLCSWAGVIDVMSLHSKEVIYLSAKKRGKKESPSLCVAAWHPSSTCIAVGSSEGGVSLWNVKNWKISREWSGHDDRVTGFAWSPCGSFLASTSSDTTVKIWSIKKWFRPLIHTFSKNEKILSCAWRGPTLMALSQPADFAGDKDSALHVWDVQGSTLINSLPWKATRTNPLTSEDGDGFSLALATLSLGSLDDIIAVDWSSNRGNIIMGGFDGILKIVNTSKKRIGLLKGREGMITSLALSPCGKYIASGSVDASVKIWDLENHKVEIISGSLFSSPGSEWECPYKELPTPITSIVWLPCGNRLMVSNRGDISGFAFIFEILFKRTYDIID